MPMPSDISPNPYYIPQCPQQDFQDFQARQRATSTAEMPTPSRGPGQGKKKTASTLLLDPLVSVHCGAYKGELFALYFWSSGQSPNFNTEPLIVELLRSSFASPNAFASKIVCAPRNYLSAFLPIS
jgi:hypothetical protein